MLDLRIAIRNVLRNRRRTSLTLLSIIAGSVALIVFGGFIDYSFWGLRESTIRTQTGHIQIYKKGYREKGGTNPLAYGIPNASDVVDAIKTVPHVDTVSPALKFSGLIGDDKRSVICVAEGMEPDLAAKRASFLHIVDGSGLSKYAPEGALLGKGLADGMGAKVDDYLTLLSTTRGGAMNAVDLQIRGIFQSGAKDYDDVGVIVPLDRAKTLLGTEEVLSLTLMLDETESTDATKAALETLFTERGWELEMATWSDLAIFYHRVVNLYTGMFQFVSVIITVIVVFSIVNTMAMAVMERVGEIGTLRAIGVSRSRIRRLFLLEGAVLGVMGGTLGLVAGIAVALLLSIKGIEMSPPPGQSRGYTAEINVVPWVLATSFAISVGSALVSSFLPARRASQMEIVDAIRHT